MGKRQFPYDLPFTQKNYRLIISGIRVFFLLTFLFFAVYVLTSGLPGVALALFPQPRAS
jgi:hypothetical protein